MDFTKMIESLQDQLGATLPAIGGALLILVIGWVAALALRALLRRGLALLRLNERVRTSTGRPVDVEGGVAAGSYYVALLLVLVAFFNALELERASASLQSLTDQLFSYAAKLAAGGALLLFAWVLAHLLRSITMRLLSAWQFDERLSDAAGVRPISESLGNVLYWLVLLLFLPGVLGALEMEGLLAPVQGMVDRILAMLPNALAAGVLGLVGWFAARVLRDLVTNLLAVAGADRLGQAAGFAENVRLSRLAGLVVYIFVLVPAAISALNALKVEAISAPATEMLGTFMSAIPNLFAAALILGIAYFVASFVAGMVRSLLSGSGFDSLPERIGLGQALSGAPAPSQIAERLIVLFVMLFAAIEAANRLDFERVSDLLAALIEFGGQVLLGVAIIGVGLWLANLARETVERVSDPTSRPLAGVVRFAILGTVFAMGLRAMGLADDIVNLAFGLTLGAVAVAVALSFGLGGREAAGRQMEHWLARLRGEAQGGQRE